MNIKALALITLLSIAAPANCQTLQGGVEKEGALSQPVFQSQQPYMQRQPLNGDVNQGMFPLNANVNYQRQPINPVISVPMSRYPAYPQAPLQTQQPQENHGIESLGCLGIHYELADGRIDIVYPESDLNRFGVRSGDYIEAINGHPYNSATFQDECVGAPGSQVELVISRVGRIVISRVDSRRLAYHPEPFFRNLASRSFQW
jgi:hypothetical protein